MALDDSQRLCSVSNWLSHLCLDNCSTVCLGVERWNGGMEMGGELKDLQVNFGANVGAGLCVSLTYNSFVLDGI